MRKKYSIATFVIILMFSYIVLNYQDTDIVDLINQELASTPASSGKRNFNMLDATKYTDSMYPWIGFPVVVLSESQLLGEGNNANVPPDELKVKELFIKHKSEKRLILNISSWHIASDKEQDVMTDLHVKWYLQVISWAKEVLPDSDIGIFGIPYSPWSALKSTEKNMLNFQRVNELLKPLIVASDTLYPFFQVFNYEESDLYYLMGVQLYIAKTSGKPVYPIISRKNTVAETGFNKLIPVDFIKQQCDFIRKNADGMVWWSSSSEQWDNHWYEAVSEQCFI